MFRYLRRNLGTYKSSMLVIVTLFLWFVSVARVVDDGSLDMLSSLAAGTAAVVPLVPIVRVEKYRLLYLAVNSVLGVIVVGSAMALQFVPPPTRNQCGIILFIAAGFYVHSVLWVYSRYDLSL